MAKEDFTYGELSVEVADVGEGVAPWDERGEARTEYEIRVKGAGGAYKSSGWGSIRDFEEGKLDHRGMAWSVLTDLYSAAMDPDEFITMVIGEAAGRRALEQGKIAEKVVKAAQKFDQDALVAAFEKAQEEGA